MKAVGYRASHPIEHAEALLDLTLDKPVAAGRDLLVKVEAVSVNPVDTKMRLRSQPEDGGVKVLGWDAAGTVEAVGPDATLFKPGDKVFYAGAIGRSGTNAEYHLVDERIVGRRPASLSVAEAAALPLTAITAWEALFDRLDIRRAVPGAANALLIIGGAGGVGSIAIQLARQLSDVTVIALTNLGENGMGSLIATAAAKQYVPKLSLKAVNTGISADSQLLANIENALRGRYSGSVDANLFTASTAQTMTSQRAKNLNERVAKFAPVVRVKFFKQEMIDGRDTISAVVETARRFFLWRVTVDANGKIIEMSLDEEE